MKSRDLKLLIMFLSVIIAFISCRKDLLISSDSNKPITNLDTPLNISDAKKHYYSLTSAENGSVSSKQVLNTAQQKNQRHASFENAIQAKTSKYSYVELPLQYDTSKLVTPNQYLRLSTADRKQILTQSFDRLIIYKNKSTGIINERIVSYIPDKSCLGKFSVDVTKNRTGKIDPNFTGWLIYQKLDKTRLFGIRVIYGNPVKSITFSNRERSKKKSILSTESCTTTIWTEYEITCTQYAPYNGAPFHEVCEWVETGNQWEEENCDPLGPGDPECYEDNSCNGDPCAACDNENQTSDITSRLSNPCLDKVWQKVKNNLDTELGHMLRNTFDTNHHINFTIRDGATVQNKPADTEITRDRKGADGIHYFDVKVTLNQWTLPKSSEEYIMNVIFHEVLHSYFDANKQYYEQQFEQHREMLGVHLENIRDAMQRISPNVTDAECYAMAMRGMADVFTINPPLWQETLNKYHITNQDVLDVAKAHRDGTAGTPTACK